MSKIFQLDKQSDAWAKFLMNGDPAALADYFTYGGKFEGMARKANLELLRTMPRLRNPGGRNSWRDYETYVEITSIFAEAILTETKSGERPTLRKTQLRYADQTGQELRAVERQYTRGSEIFSSDSKIFERLDENYDK